MSENLPSYIILRHVFKMTVAIKDCYLHYFYCHPLRSYTLRGTLERNDSPNKVHLKILCKENNLYHKIEKIYLTFQFLHQ